jgi:thiol-disulfide isomerase/thioredoxin
MRWFFTLAISVAFAAPALSLQGDANSADAIKPMVALKLRSLDGKPFDADRLKGNILVLDFWATWCVPCILEIPELNRLQQKYASKGVKVVGVTMASGEAAAVKSVVERLRIRYTILIGDDDQSYELNIMGYPTTYIVTKDWKIYRRYVGAGPIKNRQLEEGIRQLLSSDQKAIDSAKISVQLVSTQAPLPGVESFTRHLVFP